MYLCWHNDNAKYTLNFIYIIVIDNYFKINIKTFSEVYLKYFKFYILRKIRLDCCYIIKLCL